MSITTEPRRILTPAEVAAVFRVNPKTVTRWANDGKIKSFRTLGGHRRFYASDVVAAMRKMNIDPEGGGATTL